MVIKKCKDCNSYNIAVFEECQIAGCCEPARFQETTNMWYCVKHMKDRIHNTGDRAVQFCPNCYKQLPTYDKHCKYCGQLLKGDVSSEDSE